GEGRQDRRRPRRGDRDRRAARASCARAVGGSARHHWRGSWSHARRRSMGKQENAARRRIVAAPEPEPGPRTTERKGSREESMRRLVRTCLFTLVAALVSTAATAQDKPVHLKFAHWVPTTHPVHAAAQAWLASIEKASNGTITGTIFPAQQLGKAFD